MNIIHLLSFEFTHFTRDKSKVLSYCLFTLACFYAIFNGFELQRKQRNTIENIQLEQQKEIQKVVSWFDEGKTGPEDRSWVDIHEPYWSLLYAPIYTIKKSSPLLPLGLGQSEQYGYYKEVTIWSSTYDNDMVEEIANPERLVNGNIDFSFLVIYLLPLLLIVLTYNIGGLEKDAHFERLVKIQFGSLSKWLGFRFSFYVTIVMLTVVTFILGVAYINSGLPLWTSSLGGLLLLSVGYILFFSTLFFGVLIYSSGSRSNAFNMIGIWLLLCLIIPGSTHQYVSTKVPVNYMTDFLDVNRKEAYATYSLPTEALSKRLFDMYPKIMETEKAKESVMDEKIVRRSVSALINNMNKNAIAEIEQKNEIKNQLICSSYWFNPISFVQNQWNFYTKTDYYAYRNYRENVQQSIDQKISILIFDTWNQKNIDKKDYEQYIQDFK